jgi:hypothetical protein
MTTKFWDDLRDKATEIREEWTFLWAQAGLKLLTQAEAQRTLEVMWLRSHLDILEHMPGYMKYFPTTQLYNDRLMRDQSLWWVDHSTAGVNGWGTLGWFSAKPRKHTKKFTSKTKAEAYAKRRKGKVYEKNDKYYVSWTGKAGASTHFVVHTDGTPFYLVKIEDGCWGEPKRNGDGIHVEMVNALVVRRKGNTWNYWAGPLPEKILEVQTPVTLDQKFRGATHMLPYVWEQVIANIKLKRICIAATGGANVRMAKDRMSQHTDWRSTKFDMGPLWPFDMCNNAAFENYPIEDYDFVQQFVRAPGMDRVVDPEELELIAANAESEDEDHDVFDEDESIESTKEIQDALIKLYGSEILPKWGADGMMGTETTTAARHFQTDWNKNQPDDRIKVDGIPGTQTCGRLEKALEMGQQFKTS